VGAASIIRATIIALMMEAARTSETSVNIYLITRQYIVFLLRWFSSLIVDRTADIQMVLTLYYKVVIKYDV
jgi:hypothetical protein